MAVRKSSQKDYYLNYEYEVENEGKIVILVFIKDEDIKKEPVIKTMRKMFGNQTFGFVDFLLIDPVKSPTLFREITYGDDNVDIDNLSIYILSKKIEPDVTTNNDYGDDDDIEQFLVEIRKWLLSLSE